MGIQTGPMSRHVDINEEANVVGGGVNIAQRVMDCGDAGHILLSGNIAEILEQLADWSKYLYDLGVHEVKHDVQVHLFNLCKNGLGNSQLPGKLRDRKAAATPRTRPVLRIFISSTAIDLRDYRDKARDAVLRLENLPIAMQSFSAQSGQPATECRRMAAEADSAI